MAYSGAITTTDTQSSSLLSSSISSLSSSRHGASQISKIYRQASTLFLTRRLPESLSTILPVITSPEPSAESGQINGFEPAPVSKASRTTRIKVWSLYLTILNAIVELDPDEGKQAFGSQEWRNLVQKVREGDVWEEVVRHGYGGVEGDVDSDVVINLATLLLAHAKTQKLNQERLETYLASSNTPLAMPSPVPTESHGRRASRSSAHDAGTSTPRDLSARVKILELYTLHVLLRNNEWDYAREFIIVSSVLDDERREAFLQALQSLKEEHAEVDRQDAEHRRQQDEALEEARRRRNEAEEAERRKEELKEKGKSGSERDYGISPPPSPPSSITKKTKSSVKGTTRSPKKSPAPNTTLISRAGEILGNVRKLIESLAGSLRGNPAALLKMLAFVVGLLVVLGSPVARERVRRMWDRVRKTVGMGTKVSYI